ncbi:MAG: VCBS repeat-containing protein [Flavobacteriales bacterium]|nr:VCBS repeat-containing protein [Flavobacteriales bacterium]
MGSKSVTLSLIAVLAFGLQHVRAQSYIHISDVVNYPILSGFLLSGDVDQDGDIDILVPNGFLKSGKLFLNNGNAEFYSDTSANFFPEVSSLNAALIDVDQDGDLVLIQSGVFTNGDDTTFTMLNDGQGHFTPTPGAINSGQKGPFDCGDLDGDGDMDFVFRYFDSSLGLPVYVYIFEQITPGVYTFHTPSVPGHFQDNIVLFDINNDGLEDIMTVGNGLFFDPPSRVLLKMGILFLLTIRR